MWNNYSRLLTHECVLKAIASLLFSRDWFVYSIFHLNYMPVGRLNNHFDTANQVPISDWLGETEAGEFTGFEIEHQTSQ